MRRLLARPHRTSSAGFTLLEMMLVLLLIGIMTAIAMPNLGSLRRATTLEGLARQLVGIFRYARAEAIAEGMYTWVEFDSDKNRILYGTQENDESKKRGRYRRDEDEAFEKQYVVPENSYFVIDTYEELIYDDGRKVRLYFYPDGTASAAEIVLAQERQAGDEEEGRKRYFTVELFRATGLTDAYPGLADTREQEAQATESSVPRLAGSRGDEDLSRYVNVLREAGIE